MFAANQLQSMLNVSAITSQLGTFTIGAATHPMLMNGHVMPASWGNQATTINYYLSANMDGSLEYGDYTYYINCRAATEPTSRVLAVSVFNQLNRLSRPGVGAVCSIMPTLIPSDETDNYNTIVQVQFRTNGSIS